MKMKQNNQEALASKLAFIPQRILRQIKQPGNTIIQNQFLLWVVDELYQHYREVRGKAILAERYFQGEIALSYCFALLSIFFIKKVCKKYGLKVSDSRVETLRDLYLKKNHGKSYREIIAPLNLQISIPSSLRKRYFQANQKLLRTNKPNWALVCHNIPTKQYFSFEVFRIADTRRIYLKTRMRLRSKIRSWIMQSMLLNDECKSIKRIPFFQQIYSASLDATISNQNYGYRSIDDESIVDLAKLQKKKSIIIQLQGKTEQTKIKINEKIAAAKFITKRMKNKTAFRWLKRDVAKGIN
jgi:hypothetical protein